MKSNRLSLCAVAPALFLTWGAAVAASSDFSSGNEGWAAMGDSLGPIEWSVSGGNPGGQVFISDSASGGVTYFLAPAAFLGNQSAAIGTNLTFDLEQVYSGGPSQFDAEDVILQGNGLTIAFNLATNPANGAWTSYTVPLSAAGWTLNTLGGAAATSAQFASVMSGLTSLRIRAEYQSGQDVGHLDNVVLATVAVVPEPATSMLVLAGLGVGLLRSRLRRSPA